jgi:hypothetical protein
LQPYLELFGREGIYLTFYEELKSDPVAFMKAMCNWAQIEGGFFDGRDFPVTNRGLSVRNPRLHRLYFDLRNRTRAALENRRSRLGMRALGRTASRIYRLLNVKDRVQTPMSTSTREFLESYYAEEAGRLTEMFGVHPPWRSNQENSAEIRASASSQDSGRLVKSA